MEYKVNSLKDAIKICLKKYGYSNSDTHIIKNLIYNAIDGNYKYFTREAGARDYVMLQFKRQEIINELLKTTKLHTNDIDDLINKYIDKYFGQNEIKETMIQIEENSNIDKITQKIKYLNVTANNEEEFSTEIWDSFVNIFINGSKSISKEELKYDMIYAAIIKLKKYNVDNIIKPIDLNSEDLTIMDAIRIVDKYISDRSIEDLLLLINQNKVLSGLLIQNLLNEAYLKRDNDNSFMKKLDNEILNYDKIELNKILKSIIDTEDLNLLLSKISLTKEQLTIALIQNSLLVYMYSKDKDINDMKDLYSSDTNSRLQANNMLINNIKSSYTTKDNLIEVLSNLDNKIIYFLLEMYVTTRSSSKNIKTLKNSVFYGTNEELEIYDILSEKDIGSLIEEQHNNYSKAKAA